MIVGVRARQDHLLITKKMTLSRELCDPIWLACGGGEGKQKNSGGQNRHGSTFCTSDGRRQVPIDRESRSRNCCLSHGGSQRQNRYSVLGPPRESYRRAGCRHLGLGWGACAVLCCVPCRTTSSNWQGWADDWTSPSIAPHGMNTRTCTVQGSRGEER